jgi:uncharacterized membrane protein
MKPNIVIVGGVAGGATAVGRSPRGIADVANVSGGHLSMFARDGFNWETT